MNIVARIWQFFAAILTAIYILAVIYPVYWMIVVIFLAMRLIGFVKILHEERIPDVRERVVMVPNHKGMLGVTFLAPAILWKSTVLYPLRGPLNVADKFNFWKSWYFWWFRPFLIPVDRNGKSDKSLLRMKRESDKGRFFIYPIEPGRTEKGKEFLYSQSGNHYIRKPKDGMGLLVSKTGYEVVPLWIEGAGNEAMPMPTLHGRMFNIWGFLRNIILFRVAITIRVGERIRFPIGMDKAEITRIVAERLLALADEQP